MARPCTLGLADREAAGGTGEEAACTKAGKLPIGEALDAVPLSRFMVWHVARMVAAWACMAMSQEATPYTFPGLKRDPSFKAGHEGLAAFAAASPAGNMLGAALGGWAVDCAGRRTTAVAGSALAAITHFAIAAANSWSTLVTYRAVQCVFSALVGSALVAWFVEFLPTHRRGQLLASFSIGWPIGRGVVILVASKANDHWRVLMSMGGVGFVALAFIMFTAFESPRFLVVSGKADKARRVLAAMHASSGGRWNDKVTLVTTNDSDSDSERKSLTSAFGGGGSSTAGRFWALLTEHTRLLLFVLVIFAALASTTVLIDTWGPDIFRQLIEPEGDALPHGVLMSFNLGDLAGIVVSIIVADRLGRRGSFLVGFLLQGLLFGSMAEFGRHPALIIGIIASGCRCFAWEAAGMFTLEVFPTELRAMAVSVTQTSMRLFSIGAVELSGRFVGGLNPRVSLLTFAALLSIAGFFVMLFFPMETANTPMVEGRERRA